MSLTKEQCERALSDLKMANEYPVSKYNDSRLIDHHLITFKQLIYEHFEVIKEKERLEKSLDKACELISSDICINCYSCYFKKECNYKKTNMCIANNMNKEEWKEWCLKGE